MDSWLYLQMENLQPFTLTLESICRSLSLTTIDSFAMRPIYSKVFTTESDPAQWIPRKWKMKLHKEPGGTKAARMAKWPVGKAF